MLTFFFNCVPLGACLGASRCVPAPLPPGFRRCVTAAPLMATRWVSFAGRCFTGWTLCPLKAELSPNVPAITLHSQVPYLVGETPGAFLF